MPNTSGTKLPFESLLHGKRVLVTGHTGFTGGWAVTWLRQLGAEVTGLSLAPETRPNLCAALGLDAALGEDWVDIRSADAVLQRVASSQPDAILHLAAQPLVRRSYREPVETFATNVMGTVHVLDAARLTPSVKAVVAVTTDKVYRNREWAWPYREDDALGGKDPYSASKSACEMVIDSYRASFRGEGGSGLAIATARGGNIIGGGDWSDDRLIPDFVRAVTAGTSITLRYPDATRPWQHVLALVQGYFTLLAGLLTAPAAHARAWNLGPTDPAEYSVRAVLEQLAAAWVRPDLIYLDDPLPEASALALDSSLARRHLGWNPPWDTPMVVRKTAEWYRAYYDSPGRAEDITRAQLDEWRRVQLA